MTKATNNVARVAAAVAGLGLVAMSFAPMAGAQTTTTTTTTTSTASVTFTRDLTIGSTGADVTALQTWLIGKGFSIPAGATGYFGSQTKAAVAAFQAANAITPAVGYFGPITRAKVASMGGSTTTGLPAGCTTTSGYSTTTGVPCNSGSSLPAGCTSTVGFSPTTGMSCSGGSTSTGGLSGGEASFSGYTLQSGNDVAQGDTNQEIAVAQFNVRGGDVNVQRVSVDLLGTVSGDSYLPWKYFTTLYVYSNGKKIGSVDVSSKDAWTQSGNTYSVDIPTNGIVKEADNQELSIRADAVSTIDSTNADQVFHLDIPDNGIRAIDSAGLQEYSGKTATVVNVGITTAQSGKLNVTTDSNNPAAGVIVANDTTTSDSYDLLAFDIRNSQDTSVDFNTMVFHVATTTATGSSAANLAGIVRRATLTLDGDTYTGTVSGAAGSGIVTFSNLNTSVSGNSTVTGTLSVELYGQTSHFAATGESLTATLANADVTAANSTTGDTPTLSGSATGKTQSIAVNAGITVANASGSSFTATNNQTASASTGSFALKFDVTANGTSDVYIPKTIAAVSSSTANDTTHGANVVTDLVGSTTSATSVSASLASTAGTDADNSGYYVVHAGSTETFTANVTIDPTAAAYYQVGLKDVNYTTVSTGGSLQNLTLTPTDYASPQGYIQN